MASERNSLAGCPGNALIRRVRSVLRQYAACRPPRDDRNWRLTWEWAAACCERGELFLFKQNKRRRPWPSPNEIASQYLFLVLAEMRSNHALRLPWRASQAIPASVAKRMVECGIAGHGVQSLAVGFSAEAGDGES